MKVLRSSIFRAICAMITGGLLVHNPDNTVRGLTIAIGVLFLVSGVISCLTYLSYKKNPPASEVYDAEGNLIMTPQPAFPIVGVGSILLGLILAIMPDAFITSLMYILGAILILGALNQYMTLLNVTRGYRLPFWFWLPPTLTLFVGIFVIAKPMETAALPLLIIGWCLIFYGVTESVNSIKIYYLSKNSDITKA